MKKILGLDLGTNSIGWALIEQDFEKKAGKIIGMGSRIIPMSKDILDKFGQGKSHSQTAERTGYRGTRRLYQRANLRRERLHRVLNIMGFLPEGYAHAIDFEKHKGQFKDKLEPKINYRKNNHGKHKFIFKDSFNEMLEELKQTQPQLFTLTKNGKEKKVPYDWTIYYLRKKALSQPISKEELAWVILHFNQKRGYYQLRGDENKKEEKGKLIETFDEEVVDVQKISDKSYIVTLSDKTVYQEDSDFQMTFKKDIREVEITTENMIDKQTGNKITSKKKKVLFLKTLTVEDVLDMDTIDKNGLKHFKIKLSNGNEFIKKKKNFIDWKGKKKTVLYSYDITEKVKVNISAPEETSWPLLKKKSEQEINIFNKQFKSIGVGLYIYKTLLQNPSQKIRGKLVRTIERKYYKDELIAILEKQKEYHPELSDKNIYQKSINELYPNNEAHRNNISDKDLKYLLIDDIIFYQRPLKSKKSTIANCRYETREYIDENGEKQIVHLKGISKSHPLFQEFRLWQFIQNLRIYQKEKRTDGKLKINADITHELLQNEEDWTELFDFLNTKEEIDEYQLLNYFSAKKLIPKQGKDEPDYRWNYVENKTYPANSTRTEFIKRLKKVDGIPDPVAFLTEKTELGNKQIRELSREEQLWHIVYSIKDKNEFKLALEKFAKRHHIDENSFRDRFLRFPPFENKYGSYSQKALNKILPLMRRGKYWNEEKITKDVKDRIDSTIERLQTIDFDETQIGENIVDDEIPKQILKSFCDRKNRLPYSGLSTSQACYAVYEKHSEAGDIVHWNNPADIDKYLEEFKQHSLRNPIVEQVVTETLRVVRDIWEYYAKEMNIPFTEKWNDEKKKNEKYFDRLFDEIHIELGRDMKNPADIRKRITEQITEKENTNHRIREVLKELKEDHEIDGDIRIDSTSQQEILKIYEEGVFQNSQKDFKGIKEDEVLKIRKNPTPSKNEIIRYKLWLQQGYTSPYTGQVISLSRLFTEDYQIEHIIPQSRHFDDSLNNKVICESAINPAPYKGNQLGYEFIKNNRGQIIPELSTKSKTVRLFTLEEYEYHCKKYFKKTPKKLENLLREDIPESFIERQLNDTRYISKLIKGLLSNIVREEGEQEAISKFVIPVNGVVTDRLKKDWGLNDQWNKIIAPRFKRMNEISKSTDFYFYDEKIGDYRNDVPDSLKKGLNKKRIDHRHHALDAIVIACATRDHVAYLNNEHSKSENKRYDLKHKLCFKTTPDENGNYKWKFHKPWERNFTFEVKEELEKTIVSFKQNLRVLTKTNNKYWSYKDESGQLRLDKSGKPKKELINQTKGDNRAIRKPLHKETFSAKVYLRKNNFVNFEKALENKELIVDQFIRKKVHDAFSVNDNKLSEVINYFKKNPLTIDDQQVKKVEIYVEANATRTRLSGSFTRKQLENLTDTGIQKILENHVKNYIDDKGKERFDLAFNHDGIDDLNKNITSLNNGKPHQPIYHVRIYEIGSKFSVGYSGNNTTKFVETAKGTNLYFAIYSGINKKEQKIREYKTIPLNEVIERLKQGQQPAPEKYYDNDGSEYDLLFTLSPNDLVYVPTDDEIENQSIVDFHDLNKEQVNRIMIVNDFSGVTCYFTPNSMAKEIAPKEIDTSFNSKTAKLKDVTIKDRCWKIKVNRLGKIEI